jgi:hypothetical protein
MTKPAKIMMNFFSSEIPMAIVVFLLSILLFIETNGFLYLLMIVLMIIKVPIAIILFIIEGGKTKNYLER